MLKGLSENGFALGASLYVGIDFCCLPPLRP
jgi:hypothetical protein